MAIITIAGQKGGVGKTTLAVHIAAEWAARGKRVLLVDADPQRTALTWGEVAAEQGHKGPSVIAMGDNLRSQLPAVSEGYDITIVDCPPRHGKRQTWAIAVSELTILPCGPTSPDVWALAESVDLVNDVAALRPEMRAVILITRKDPRTLVAKEARAALSSAGLLILNSELASRITYPEAITAGQGVTSYASGSIAANELRRVVDELEEVLAGQTGGAEYAA
jgi:chromosome partitioning protein